MRVLCSVCAIVFAAQPVKADLLLLYDGTGFPANQEWLSYADDGQIFGGTATQSTIPTGVRLQTDLLVRGGYSNHTPLAQLKNAAFPNLNRQLGFELSFTLAITSEIHENANRAGFSVILLGSDSRGIELGFWGNEIWGQTANPPFTHGESVAIDTSQQRSYQLRIVNDTYSLIEGANTLLSGSVRDYSATGQIPYTLRNYLFLGDNTTSASANIQLGAVTLQSNLTAVPEPSSLSLVSTSLFIGYIATCRRRKRVQSVV